MMDPLMLIIGAAVVITVILVAGLIASDLLTAVAQGGGRSEYRPVRIECGDGKVLWVIERRDHLALCGFEWSTRWWEMHGLDGRLEYASLDAAKFAVDGWTEVARQPGEPFAMGMEGRS